MDERTWLESSDSEAMFSFIQGQATIRKLRLFFVASAECLSSDLKKVEGAEKAVRTAERLADSAATEQERLDAVNALYDLPVRKGQMHGGNWFEMEPPQVISAYFAAILSVANFDASTAFFTRNAWRVSHLATARFQPDILREIMGNPFRPIIIDPVWRTSNVTHLSRDIYESKSFHRMPELAEELQKTGCTCEELLTHCRVLSHVRGCWALDLLLSKP